MAQYKLIMIMTAGFLTACGTSAKPKTVDGAAAFPAPHHSTAPQAPTSKGPRAQPPKISRGDISLPDKAAYQQTNLKWANDRLGGSGEPLSQSGCVVTSAAIAMTNLGYAIDPGTLNRQLKSKGGYTDRGWLVWDALSDVSRGKIKAHYFDYVTPHIVDGCLASGMYPIAKFKLPNRQTHWAVIVKKDTQGYHMRDPLYPSNAPHHFPDGLEAIDGVRCIGTADAVFRPAP